jgi:hypothetical protein
MFALHIKVLANSALPEQVEKMLESSVCPVVHTSNLYAWQPVPKKQDYLTNSAQIKRATQAVLPDVSGQL